MAAIFRALDDFTSPELSHGGEANYVAMEAVRAMPAALCPLGASMRFCDCVVSVEFDPTVRGAIVAAIAELALAVKAASPMQYFPIPICARSLAIAAATRVVDCRYHRSLTLRVFHDRRTDRIGRMVHRLEVALTSS